MKGNRQIIHIKYYNPAIRTIFGVTLYTFDKRFRLADRIDAGRAAFSNGNWRFYDTLEQTLNPETGAYEIQSGNERIVALDLLPTDLQGVIKKSEEMGFAELRRYIRKVENEGYDATIYKVDLYSKLAFPLVCIIMCMAGVGIAVRGA